MTELLADQVAGNETDVLDDEGGHNRSTIAFPYGHLGDAERVAGALQNRGYSATMDEVAAELGTTTSSGTFRTKVASARIFGVIEVTRGQVSLTSLGRRLIDPKEKAQARTEAFLHVPLFNAVYDKYKGGLLPPNKGLEAAIEALGVSPKQKARARQTLQRSAERAGFFKHGTDRLVAPATGQQETPEDQGSGARDSVDGAVPSLSPMMIEMWLTLLRGEGKKWPPEKIAEFVKTARQLDKLLTTGS